MKPEEKGLATSKEEKIKKALKTIIEAFRLARARGRFPNSDIVNEGIMEAALEISKNLDDKMNNMKIPWIASISIYFALKEDKKITNHCTEHSELTKQESFVALARKCKQALSSTPSDQTPPVTRSPIEDTVTASRDAGPVRIIPRPGGSMIRVPDIPLQVHAGDWIQDGKRHKTTANKRTREQEDSGTPLQVYAGDVIVNGKIKRRSKEPVEYQVRHFDYKF